MGAIKLTYLDENTNQHLQYLPFGESFIDQRTINHDIRFKFTGKDRDSKTGFDYFGARYYDPEVSVWLSVDPLADKYPSLSSYMYTAGNPVMLVDPDGRRIKPGNDKAAKLIFKTINNVFQKESIAMKFFITDDNGEFVTKDVMQGFSYGKFNRKFKKEIRKYNRGATNKISLQKNDIKAAFNLYKKADSEKSYEVLAVSSTSLIQQNQFYNDVGSNENTSNKVTSNDFKHLINNFKEIEENNRPILNMSVEEGGGLRNYYNDVSNQKYSFLNSYLPNKIKVFSSGNVLLDISVMNDKQSVSLLKNVLTQ